MTWFEKWKGGEIFIHKDAADLFTPVLLLGTADGIGTFATVRVSDGTPLLSPDGSAIRINPKEVEFGDDFTIFDQRGAVAASGAIVGLTEEVVKKFLTV